MTYIKTLIVSKLVFLNKIKNDFESVLQKESIYK